MIVKVVVTEEHDPELPPHLSPGHSRHAAANISALIGHSKAKVVDVFDDVPYIVMELDKDALDALSASRYVEEICLYETFVPLLQDSAIQVDAPDAWSLGFDGFGWKIAVIDTGVIHSHQFVSGKVGEIACFVLKEIAIDIWR